MSGFRRGVLSAFVWVTVCCAKLVPVEDGQGVYLNRSFSTRCEALHAIEKFALSLHLTKTEKDFIPLRADSVRKLAEVWNVDPPSEAFDKCQDIDTLLVKIQEKVAPAPTPDLYSLALKAFIQNLDPHSAYMSPQEAASFDLKQNNENYGYGIEFRKTLWDPWVPVSTLTIEQLLPGSSASKELHPGDQVTHINGKEVKGKLFAEAIGLLGSANSATVRTLGQSADIELKKEVMKWPPVLSRVIDWEGESYGLIQYRQFTISSAEHLRKEIAFLEQNKGVSGYILDLRFNYGGALDEVAKAVGFLMGPRSVVTLEGNRNKKYPSTLNPFREYRTQLQAITNLPIVVIVDQSSASAAEILAGSLKYRRALILGDRTFGKGTGWTALPLSAENSFGGRIFLTMYSYFLQDGSSPQGRGIKPDIRIPDEQLEEVIESRRKRGLQSELVEEDQLDPHYVGVPEKNHSDTYSDSLAHWLNVAKNKLTEEYMKHTCTPGNDCRLLLAASVLSLETSP